MRVPIGALLLTLTACAVPRPAAAPDRVLDPAVARLRFEGLGSRHFADPSGAPCSRVRVSPAASHLGWMSESEDPACRYDTVDAKAEPGWLELAFSATVPDDGDYRLVQSRVRLTAAGRVEARSSAFCDYHASARAEVSAAAPSCQARWRGLLGRAQVSGGSERGQSFAGSVVLGEVALRGCRAGERLELRVRLLAESNRGSVDVDWFGFTLAEAGEAHAIFGLRPLPPVARTAP